MQAFGIVEELDTKLRRNVLLHSVEGLPQDAVKILQRNGLDDSFAVNMSQPVKISDAKGSHMMNPAEFESENIATKVPNNTEIGQAPIGENVDETTMVQGQTKSNHSGELSASETKRMVDNLSEHLKHHSYRYKFKGRKFTKGAAH